MVQKRVYLLTFLFGAFCFFLLWIAFLSSLSLLHLHLFLHLYLYSFLEKGRHFYLVDLSSSRLLT